MYYNMNPQFYTFPVQPMPMTSQGFLLMHPFQQQYSQNTRCAEPNKPFARKRKHVCPVRSCGKRFTTSGNLSRHKRLHGKIDPLSCPIDGCMCVFPSTNKLERHLKFHYGGDVKVCHADKCGRTFSTTGNLNRHMKRHHGGVVTTPKQDLADKVNTKTWSPCASTSGETDTDSDVSVEPWRSEPSTNAVSFECVWNDDLLDTLACILDDDVDVVQEQKGANQNELL
ncbi:hypothetical protein DVH05_006326 [Phytophthora capsici]|nr:hypothetical protein DVH05_006407 [Phytophthora capsici]KAG1704318.1 hypothetical protein DVH05_006326 [Phytophthora capsici]